MAEIRANTVLPAARRPVTLHTADRLELVGELALPVDAAPVATIVCLHPLPTEGGMMDSHLFRKAANRLPALAGFAVLRFNTRGTASDAGRSQGSSTTGSPSVSTSRRRSTSSSSVTCRRPGSSA